jgi:hypothetical protein
LFFGPYTEVLQEKTRLGLARLMLALAAGQRDATLAEAAKLGLELTNAAPDFALTAWGLSRTTTRPTLNLLVLLRTSVCTSTLKVNHTFCSCLSWRVFYE